MTIGRATTTRSGEGTAENVDQVVLDPNFQATAFLKTNRKGGATTKKCDDGGQCGTVSSVSIDHDFALLHLVTPLPTYSTVTLDSGTPPSDGTGVTLFGYGHRSEVLIGSIGADNLKTVPAGTYQVNDSACGNPADQICFSDNSSTIRTETGDSGGPWFQRVNACGPGGAPQIGVQSLLTSSGISIAGRVSVALPWIRSVVSDLPSADNSPACLPANFEPGFTANTFAANDDSSIAVGLPFNLSFGGSTYSSVYLNNNGDLTFDSPISQYTPQDLSGVGQPIIAPFWADVDTLYGGQLTYGSGTVSGHAAFGVDWNAAGCFASATGGTDSFQVVLINRSDLAPGAFQIEFNYGPMAWDSGQASGGSSSCLGGVGAAVGYSDSAGSVDQFTGSLTTGALIDGGADALSAGSLNSTVKGRYDFIIGG